MLAHGVRLEVVSEILGHASIAITEEVYGTWSRATSAEPQRACVARRHVQGPCPGVRGEEPWGRGSRGRPHGCRVLLLSSDSVESPPFATYIVQVLRSASTFAGLRPVRTARGVWAQLLDRCALHVLPSVTDTVSLSTLGHTPCASACRRSARNKDLSWILLTAS
jgi:hypothetical protein